MLTQVSRHRNALLILAIGVALLGAAWAGVALWRYHATPQFCASCHVMQPYLASLQSSEFLVRAHAEEGVVCLDCHEASIPQQMGELLKYVTRDYSEPLAPRELSRQECYSCHEHGSYSQVVARTQGYTTAEGRQANPHASPHYGEQDCGSCHKMHRVSVDFCAPCHGATAAGPQWPPP